MSQVVQHCGHRRSILRYEEVLRDIAAAYQCGTPGCACIGGDEELCVGAQAKLVLLEEQEEES